MPGFRVWQLCRTGALRRSGGVAVLVREGLPVRACMWQPPSQPQTPSPHHMWVRLDGPIFSKPLFLAAAYLPPYRSKYGCNSPADLADFFTLLGDEVAEACATPGGAHVLLAGDWNGHTAAEPDSADHSALLRAAYDHSGEFGEEVLLPCAEAAAAAPAPRASRCNAAVCEQGRALLQFCQVSGLLIANGRLPGDTPAQPTFQSGSVIDYFIGSPSLLQAASLRVLPPIPEYRQHHPLALQLAPPAVDAAGIAAGRADPESEGCGPPPTFAAPLRLKPDRLSSFADELAAPANAAALRHLAAAASSDPLQAATQLHTVLYEAAAAVFPAASGSSRHSRGGSSPQQLRRRHQPWFDAECEAARRQLRLQLQLAAASGQAPHLARELTRAAHGSFQRLRRRKAAEWQRQQGSALLKLQRLDPRAFFKRWRQRQAANPIPAATWRRHFVDLQLKRIFKPTTGAAAPAAAPVAAAPAAAAGTAAAAAGSAPASPDSSLPPPAPSELDGDITQADVAAALKKLSPGSASLGPLKAALIQAGKTALLPVLACLFTAVFRSGAFPPEWALGAITPIHKKGDTADPNNYRGITVGHILGKLYALALNTRLTTWLEASGRRARGQAGFRPGRGTIDNCFILRALVERARSRGVRVYCCAVDFEKAFDSVDRSLLWGALRRAGVEGTMLQAIQAMYADVPVCVRTAEGLSGCFQSTLGVKQGCPLSPLLFGVFLDDWEGHLQAAVGGSADLPRLAGRLVPPLLFADDMLLISLSAAGLQAQLHCLQAYCDAKRLTVNTAKTQVMVLRPGGGSGKPAAGETFTYAGKPLDAVRSVKYLGLTLSQLSKGRGWGSCADVLADAGRRAMFAMRRRAWELGASSVAQQCSLFDVFVTPVLSYGCEVWGPDLLMQPHSTSVERVHRWFCRRVQGLPPQVTSAVSLAELGRWPLHLRWVRQLARFWNRLQTSMAEPDSPLGWALADNLALMREGGDLATGAACWCRRWQQFLQSAPTESGTLVWLTQLDAAAIVERATQAYLRQAAEPTAATAAAAAPPGASSPCFHPTTLPCPRLVPDSCLAPPALLPPHQQPTRADPCPPPPPASSKFAYYLDTIRGDLPLGQPAPHLSAVAHPALRTSLSRFRTSCHDLRIERERYLPPVARAPRSERTCLQCASLAIEDETHMVFHCPLYDHLRFEYADLFPPDLPPTIPCFLSQDQTRLAEFIHACLVYRRRNA